MTLFNDSGLMATYAKMQIAQTRKESGGKEEEEDLVQHSFIRRPRAWQSYFSATTKAVIMMLASESGSRNFQLNAISWS